MSAIQTLFDDSRKVSVVQQAKLLILPGVVVVNLIIHPCSCLFAIIVDCVFHKKIKRDRKRLCGCLHSCVNVTKQKILVFLLD